MISTFKAYAKINIGLRILGKRADGYHNIETIFHRIDLFDEISFSRSPTLGVSCTPELAPSNESNICYKAASLLRNDLEEEQGVHISISKRIPVGAGLGGGSSDAGTVLNHLPGFWSRSIDGDKLREIALQLGADVPFFLGGGSAVGTQRGDELEFILLDFPFWILLCNPNIHVPTDWAYKQIHVTEDRRREPLKDILLEALTSSRWIEADLNNDFEPAVFARYPEIKELKNMMLNGGALFASMSGSGSSVYGFFRDKEAAVNLAASLQSIGYKTFLTNPHFLPRPTEGGGGA